MRRMARDRVREFTSRPDYNKVLLHAVERIALKRNDAQARCARAIGVLLIGTKSPNALFEDDPLGVIQALEALDLEVPE